MYTNNGIKVTSNLDKIQKKCFGCGKPMKGKKIFCKDCEKKPEQRKSTSGTFKGGWHSW